MGTAQLVFAWIVRWIGPLRMTGSDVTGSDMNGSDVSHVTESDISHVIGSDRKYVLRMCKLKLSYIRTSGAFWPEMTKSRDRKRTYSEVALTGSRFFACPTFFALFSL